MAERRRPRPTAEPPGPNQVLEVAARYLATRPRSAWEVRRRLVRTGADPAVVEETIERLVELGLVDDQAFARWWADQRDRHAPRGRRMIEAELRQRGIGRDTIETLRERDPASERASEDAAMPASEAERAAAALSAHLRGRPLPTDRRALQRIGMYLVRRGFDPDTARTAIRAVQVDNRTDDATSDPTHELS